MTTPASIASSPVARRYIHDKETLNLDEKLLDDEEVTLLAKELATNTTLKRLSLGYNRIGDAGAVALAGALASNKTLKELYLRENELVTPDWRHWPRP
jgi:Ran GTPase-activating protein (RanGAP) involved in mRNA processing and transport